MGGWLPVPFRLIKDEPLFDAVSAQSCKAPRESSLNSGIESENILSFK